MEFEADHIGLILMASAGYDPRVALSMYKRLGKIYGEDSSWPDYLHSHPSMKKRKEMMAQTNIMEEALAIYRDVRVWGAVLCPSSKYQHITYSRHSA